MYSVMYIHIGSKTQFTAHSPQSQTKYGGMIKNMEICCTQNSVICPGNCERSMVNG